MVKYKRNPIKECIGGKRMKKYYNPYYDDETVERVLDHYKRYIRKKTTVRQVAKETGYSRNTVHRDLTKRLPKINSAYAEKATERLNLNKRESASRAGKASAKKAKAKTAKKKGRV